MFFLALMATLSALAYLPQFLWGPRNDWRMALRHGMAGAFLFTGIDHFVSLETRYLPMMPPYLEHIGAELVIASGVAEIAGAIGLLIPLGTWRRLGMPNLRPMAGVGLALLLSVMVVANAHVAETGTQVAGLSAGPGYSAIRPLLQPLFILWALLCSDAVFPRARAQANGPADSNALRNGGNAIWSPKVEEPRI